MPRGNIDNLKTLTSEQAREYGSKGGKAGAEAKRKQKNLREAISSLLAQKVGEGTLPDDPNVKALMEQYGLNEKDRVTALAAAAFLSAAIAGSPQHAKLLLEMSETEGARAAMPAKIIISYEDNEEDAEV